MRVALATAAMLPHGSPDDQVLIEAMRAQGMAPVSVIWDEPTDWREFDAVILRSIWDYHLKPAKFFQWLDALDAAGVTVHNTTRLARWNADKRYMLELEQRGVHITPTRLAERGAAMRLQDIYAETGWTRMVIKPTIASTGYRTWVTDGRPTPADEERFRQQIDTAPALVQEFISGVYDGELSLVFFGGSYSHAVIKRAAGNEFRVHVEHGGSVDRYEPDAALIAWAEQVLAAAPEPGTYARVDAVMGADGPRLMELEQLDPELFFLYRPEAAQRMIGQLDTTLHAR